MLWPGVENLRLTRVPRGGEERAVTLVRGLARAGWREGAGVLKGGDDGAVFDALVAGEGVVIKTRRVRTARDRLSSALGTSRLGRQWNGATALDAIGVRAAMPILLCRGVDEQGAIIETLVMERIEGKTLLEHLRDRDLEDAEVRALTESMARDLEAMWLRAFNRDHKPSNLVVAREGGDVRAVVVDTVGVRRNRGTAVGSNTRLARMLASLWIEPTGARCPARVREAYRLVCRVCDAPTPKGKKKAGWERRKAYGFARRLWSQARSIVEAHGDPTPRDSPFPIGRAGGG
jgi:hypothetical protein